MENEELKAALRGELDANSLNFGRIIELAHELSQTDDGSVRFSVDASHVSRLGLELVSKQETAISELIKNAYDADAVTVDVVFKNSDVRGGTLEIIDSGSGMTRRQLIDGFMRISTPDKAYEPRSPVFGRQRAGRKGIGRFAAQRLGQQLVITTQRDDEAHSLQLVIDWNQFKPGVDLFQIASQVCERASVPTPGTTLLITGLRDSWSEAQIRRAYRYVSDLLQPFPLDRKSSGKTAGSGFKVDPGFQASFFRENSGELISIASHEQDIHGAAIAEISAEVDAQGVARFSVKSERYDVNVNRQIIDIESRVRSPFEEVRSYNQIPGVSLVARYFIQDELPSGTKGMVREILNRVGGIRLYRNGFRVMPYGEMSDDWLSLQQSSALRQLLPPHHRTNFIGFVQISDVEGMRFQETASREGLIQNESFLQLQDFGYRALMSGVTEIARARGRKIFSSDPSPKPKLGFSDKPDPADLKERADDVANRLRELSEKPELSASLILSDSSGANKNSALFAALADEVESIVSQSEAALEEVGMLRVLASLGLTIGEFTHEVRHALAALVVTVDRLKAGQARDDEITAVSNQVMLLRGYLRYFDNAVSDNAHRLLVPHELRDVLNEFLEIMRPTLSRQKIDVLLDFDGYDLFSRPMHKSEWASILLNLFTNSLKAIHRAKVSGRVLVRSKAVDKVLQIDFCDNGDGILRENWDKIFDAFYTTSAPAGSRAAESDQLAGTGLGLKIVRDIIDSAGGDIEVIDPPEGYATCIRLSVPRATEEQIGNDRY